MPTLNQHALLIDTKNDGYIRTHLAVNEISKLAKLEQSLAVNQFTLWKVPASFGPYEIDSVIEHLQENWTNLALYIDEAYSVHESGRAGPGLTAWLTRGRSLRQSVVLCTQRPSWISLFCLSEVYTIVCFNLTIDEDRKRVYKLTGRPEFLRRTTGPHSARVYDVLGDRIGVI